MILNINEHIKFLKQLVLIIGLFFSFNISAQKDTLCLDENDNLISKEFFYKKINSKIYHGLRFETDTLVLLKSRFNFYVGELKPIVKNQLFKLLRSRHQIDTSKTLVIHYLDTLRAKSEYAKKNAVIYYDSLNRVIKPIIKSTSIIDGVKFDFSNFHKTVKHEHIQNYKSFIKLNRRCVRQYKNYKNEVLVFHFYNFNNGHPNEVKELTWYKDYSSLLKKLFFHEYTKTDFLIIKPSGEFIVGYPDSDFYNSHVSFKNLLILENWDKIKINFKKEYETVNIITE
jgi:hypothetical protein